MGFTNGLDIGTPTVALSSGNYVSSAAKVFTSGHDLGAYPVELSSANYVTSSAKIFNSGLDLGQTAISFGTPYVLVPQYKVFTSGSLLNTHSLISQPGDTGKLIVVGDLVQFRWYPLSTIPFRVQFVDETFGDIDTWAWDFGDTESSSDQNPAHTYYNTGNYLVTLTVTFSTGKVGYSSAWILVASAGQGFIVAFI